MAKSEKSIELLEVTNFLHSVKATTLKAGDMIAYRKGLRVIRPVGGLLLERGTKALGFRFRRRWTCRFHCTKDQFLRSDPLIAALGRLFILVYEVALKTCGSKKCKGDISSRCSSYRVG